MKKTPIEQRFWSKVDKTAECWLWIAGKSKAGYGYFGTEKGIEKAHRVAYRFAYGDFDPSYWVLHRCDNPPCVRPDHLFLGDAKDNAVDRKDKGRQANFEGERNPNAKLNLLQVVEIRKRFEEGENQNSIAKEFPVKRSMIGNIVRNLNWLFPALVS